MIFFSMLFLRLNIVKLIPFDDFFQSYFYYKCFIKGKVKTVFSNFMFLNFLNIYLLFNLVFITIKIVFF